MILVGYASSASRDDLRYMYSSRYKNICKIQYLKKKTPPPQSGFVVEEFF